MQRHAQREDVMKRQQREDGHVQAKERGLKQILPHSPQKEPTLPTPGSWTLGLQNYETINFCSLTHPICGTLLQQP